MWTWHSEYYVTNALQVQCIASGLENLGCQLCSCSYGNRPCLAETHQVHCVLCSGGDDDEDGDLDQMETMSVASGATSVFRWVRGVLN
jgi:hypothetical protein